jgi:hypothetical protein
MNDIEFNFTKPIVSMVGKLWDGLTFEDVPRVFEKWITRLSGSLPMKENISSSKSSFELNYSTDPGIRQGAKAF